jgi:cGMP-dependent protein kinase
MENSEMKDFGVALCRVRLHRVGYDMVAAALGEPLVDVIKFNEIKKVLGDIFLFKYLTEAQVDQTIRALERKRYAAGETIVQQGEDSKYFFLIQSGTIKVTKDGEKLRTLGRWDYLGERGLLLQEKRSASCVAEDSVICLVLDAAVFDAIVGNFKRELEHRIQLQDLNIQMEDLRLKAVVGRGSFGIVKLVYHKDDEKKEYALKCVGKAKVVKQGQQKSVCVERDINAACYHPCIMQFIKTFQDSRNIYFLTEFLGGGDMFYAIREIGNLTKEQTQFFSASIMLALEYLHARTIMYRDLKPENVLLDLKGNAKLVDVGCCKRALRTNTLVGTPEYFAPEVILGKGYTCAIDWWALGVMMHEFIVGPLPFGRNVDDQLELFREILEAP